MKKTLTFTGTRYGLSPEQRLQIDNIIRSHTPDLCRHGGCVGGDAEFHSLCLLNRQVIHVYPCNLPRYRASLSQPFVLHPIKPPLQRNEDMIDLASQDDEGLVLACPRSKQEERRSGTWRTIRYAIDMGVKLYIIYPDATWTTHGKFKHEGD